MAAFGSAIGDPARAQIVAALASGTRHTAGELARRIALAPSTTSRHLAVLVDAGLIDVQPGGRHRYFGLASADVADMLEAIDALELTETNPPQRPRPDEPLRLARSCYDHLAGRLGVELAAAMIDNELLTADELSLTDAGEATLLAIGIDVDRLRPKRRPLTRACLDWTERTHHLGGAVGAELLTHMLEHRWLVRHRQERRVLRPTKHGREQLASHFSLAS